MRFDSTTISSQLLRQNRANALFSQKLSVFLAKLQEEEGE